MECSATICVIINRSKITSSFFAFTLIQSSQYWRLTAQAASTCFCIAQSAGAHIDYRSPRPGLQWGAKLRTQ